MANEKKKKEITTPEVLPAIEEPLPESGLNSVPESTSEPKPEDEYNFDRDG